MIEDESCMDMTFFSLAGGNRQALAETRLVVARLAERVAQPLKTLVQTVTGGSAGGLDVLLSR